MKKRHLARLAGFGLTTILFRLKRPILGTIIVTDYCNLDCKHCAVNNINKVMFSYNEIVDEMKRFFSEGIRILFLSGGETLLWRDGEYDVRDLIAEGRRVGFYLINIVTNGTVTLNLPEADLVFLSLDGIRETNDEIRGRSFDTVMANLDRSGKTNICLYTAVNAINLNEIEALADLARDHPRISAISFNFHTPYRLTESLCLTEEQRALAVRRIRRLIDRHYPVFNLRSVLKVFLENRWQRPCHQCIVSEDRVRYVCGRCSEIPGLCEQCGYLFAAEFSALFSGNLRAIVEMFRTYVRYA